MVDINLLFPWKGVYSLIFSGVVLHCSLQIQSERTISAIYHLLSGKKSIQTVQDAHIYRLEQFYGVYKSLTKESFDKKVKDLTDRKLLLELTGRDNVYIPTAAAKVWLDNKKKSLPFHYFNGLQYASVAIVFFDRLLLLIQTITNSQKGHFSFIPVVDKTSIENWVKVVYKKSKGFKQKFLADIYRELHQLLQCFSNQEASIFVDRLTGYKNYGMSLEQLAAEYRMTVHDIHLILSGLLQTMVTNIHKERDNFPLFSYIIKDLSGVIPITNSAYATSKLLNKAYTIDQIARIRQLKENTIYDHIVEIALYDPSFPVNGFITEKKQREIIEAVKITKSYKLKNIKEYLTEDISYFEIRLVLAMENKLK